MSRGEIPALDLGSGPDPAFDPAGAPAPDMKLDLGGDGLDLNLGGGLIMAEALMLDLARHIGRQEAHDVIYDAAEAAISGGSSFDAALAADPRVTEHVGADQIAAMLDPAAYTDLSGDLARQAANRVRQKPV